MESAAFTPSFVWILPFASLLVAIAALPLAAPHFWASNRNKLVVSAIAGAPVAWLYGREAPQALFSIGAEYASFMVLLGGLFILSGGVFVDCDLRATPVVNSVFLLFGSVCASLIGTTGASMLFIGPLLHTNSERRHVAHTVVFFIFLVSNFGGLLTPLGPPLLLGYLRGVPFTWTLRLAPVWVLATAFVLAAYYLWDRRAYAREPAESLRADDATFVPIRVRGAFNLVLLAGVVTAVAVLRSPWREAITVTFSMVSLVATPTDVRKATRFSFGPILEVAAIFAGIFAAMIPALDLLRTHGRALPIHQPWQFFWATGALSSFLDNAPTYLTFLALGQGQGLPPEVVGVSHRVLAAISAGAVFMGASTYIGNGPNFMVRSIAESRGVKMPHFFQYMLYSGAVLIPAFLLVTFVFF